MRFSSFFVMFFMFVSSVFEFGRAFSLPLYTYYHDLRLLSSVSNHDHSAAYHGLCGHYVHSECVACGSFKGIVEVLRVKAECAVSLHTAVKVSSCRNAESAVLVHDVNEGVCLGRSAAGEAFNGKPHLFLVVVCGASLAAVKVSLIGGTDLPHRKRNASAFLLFNGEVCASFADLEQQLVSEEECRSDRLCIRASCLHLSVVHVAAVGAF